MRLAAMAGLLAVAGWLYLALLGTAAAPYLLPRRWQRYRVLLAPHLGWCVLVALGYPLNAALPFRTVAALLGALATLAIAVRAAHHPRAWWRALWSRLAWGEAAAPLALGAAVYTAWMLPYVRQRSLSALVVDSDVEHFADVIEALSHYPIGWSVAAQRGLEATPVGLAYHYVHAALSAVTGVDTFTTETPALFLMVALAVSAVWLFAREMVRLPRRWATLAVALYTAGGLAPAVAMFGWGQQTAALATVPFALAALWLALAGHDRRSLLLGGLAGALAADSLYLATAPLVGGAAALLAVAATVARLRRGTSWLGPLRRLAAVGAIVLLAGALSHLSAGSYLLENARSGFLGTQDITGRSTHVSTFASLGAALGVAPLDLVRDVATPEGAPSLRWTGAPAVLAPLASCAAVLLLAAWAASVCTAHARSTAVPMAAVLAVIAGYDVYLRVLKPFPYGEFKLLTTVWFLTPCLMAAGARSVAAASQGWTRSGRVVVGRVVAGMLACCVGAGLLATSAHEARFLSLPWGAALPEPAMRQARALVRAVPPAAPVYVSNQLLPAVAFHWTGGPSSSRAGFPSTAARQNYLARRWRGVVTSLLAFSGRPVYGVVQRYSTELRAPVTPLALEFALLDATDDPLLFGFQTDDLAASQGELRLYRRPPSGARGPAAIALPPLQAGVVARVSPDGIGLVDPGGSTMRLGEPVPAVLPPPVLPVGESFPGRLGALPGPPILVPTSPGPAGGRGSVQVGLLAPAPAHIRVVTQDARGQQEARTLALWPGLTWYTTPPLAWPADVRVLAQDVAGDAVRPVAILGTPAGQEALARSPATSSWPSIAALVPVGVAGGTLSVVQTASGEPAAAWETQARTGQAVWIGTRQLGGARAVTATGHQWDTPLPAPPETPPNTLGPWVWLDVGPHSDSAVAQPAVAYWERAADVGGLMPVPPAVVPLPLLGRPRPLPALQEGSIIRGSGADLFYVDHGALRWVPTITALERLGSQVRQVAVDDQALWQLPVALPLD